MPCDDVSGAPDSGVHDHRRLAGDHPGVERRRSGQPGRSPLETLMQLPTLVLLERIPDPVLAVAHDGTILFANAAFCDMLGHTREAALSLDIQEIFPNLPEGELGFAAIGAYAGQLVELLHRDGYIVQASMSTSAMRRRDDTVALVTFKDHTEQLWVQ